MAAKKGTATEEKLAIIAEAESSSTTKISVCRKYGISKSTLDYWRKQLLNTKNNPENEIARLRKDISKFQRVPSFITLTKKNLIQNEAVQNLVIQGLSMANLF